MTKAEREWQASIIRLGCIACIVDLNIFGAPADVHHMLSGGRRMGEAFTLALCFNHHRAGRDDEQCVSRDHNQRRFEARYGSEAVLLERTRELVKQQEALTV